MLIKSKNKKILKRKDNKFLYSKQPVNVLYEAIKEYIEETAGIKSFFKSCNSNTWCFKKWV